VASSLHNLGHVFVVKPQNFLITLLLELVVQCDLDGFPLLELYLSGAALNKMKRELI